MAGPIVRSTPNGDAPAQQSWAADLDALHAQDVHAALLLSEIVYKAVEAPPVAALAALNQLRAQFPPGAVPLTSVQFCRRAAEHRCLLAASGTALYLCFMGTKQLRDLMADANFLTQLLWEEAAAEAAPPRPAPAVHRGFLGRSAGVQLEPLLAHARRQGLRLVLCGHSLGGAVAQLCLLRLLNLLREVPPLPAALRCIAFGCPPVGNAALRDHVRQAGWDPYFTSIALPEDVVPRLLVQAHAPPPPRGTGPSAAEDSLAAEVLGAAAHEQQQQHAAAEAEAPTSRPAVGQAAAGWRAAQAARAAAAAARGQLAAAAGAAAGAGRLALAGAGRLVPPPLLPTFAHIGRQYHLLPHGLVASGGAAAPPPPPPAAAAGPATRYQPPRQVQQLLLGLHSMQHYRARAAAACWAAAGSAADDRGTEQPPVALSLDLAPPAVVCCAAARLPILPPPPAPPPPGRPVQQLQRRQKQAGVLLTVSVAGAGLEGCTGALLRLPGRAAGQLAAVHVANLARQRLRLDLQAGEVGGPAAPASALAGGVVQAAGGAVRRVAAAFGWGAAPPPPQPHTQQGCDAQPGLLLEFVVPAAAVARLQLERRRDGQLAVPAAHLVLLSDFRKDEAPVQLRAQTVWLLGLEPSLTAAVLQRLQAASSAAAAAPRTGQQRQARRVQSTPAVGPPPHSLASAGGSAALQTAAGQPHSSLGSGSQDVAGPLPAALDAPPVPPAPQPSLLQRLRQQYAAPLAQRLAGLGRKVGAGAGAPSPALPAALLRGQLLLDASPTLLAGTHGIQQQLELAAEAVRWAGRRQGGEARVPAAGWEEDGGAAEEVEDEDLAPLGRLALAARLRRGLAQSGAAAKRQVQALRQRRRGLPLGLPAPCLLLLLLDRRQLLSASFGEGLDGGVLAALRQLAAAGRACSGAPLLLAVASPDPLSAPYRSHLAYNCGLADGGVMTAGGSSRRGSVVPLLVRTGARGVNREASLGVHLGLLEAALAAYGAARWQQDQDGGPPTDGWIQSKL